MNIEKIICDYCKKPVETQVDDQPTWFGRYVKEQLIGIICKNCLKDNREKWREGKI